MVNASISMMGVHMMKTMQRLGKSLMLPVAAIMMGIGYWLDPAGYNIESQIIVTNAGDYESVVTAAGGAVKKNEGLLEIK